MATDHCSQEKRTSKAATRGRCTTSSTIDEARADATTTDETTDDEAPLLSPAQQELCLEILHKGASPAVAAAQMGVPLDSIRRTRRHNRAFRIRYDEVSQSLTENVLTALYRKAIEGHVAAQTLWLKHHPPGGGSAGGEPAEHDELERLDLRELIELARFWGVDLADEIEDAGARLDG